MKFSRFPNPEQKKTIRSPNGMQPIAKSVVAGLSAASTIAAVHAARQASTSSPARSSDIPRGTPSPVPSAITQQQPQQHPSSNAAASGSGGLLAGGPDGGGGGAINYVSSSDSSSPLSETYRPANECPASIGGVVASAAAGAAAASSKRQSASDPKTCFKQVQFHLNNIAHAAPLLKHKLGGSAAGGLIHSISPSGNASGSATAVAAATAATTTTQARLLSQIPILRSVRKTRKKRKKVKPSEAAKLSSAAEAQHQQRVLANLPPSKAFLYSCLSKAAAKVPDGKDIVYNGTFPIDQPLCSRFKNLSFSLSSTDTELDGAGMPRGFDRGDRGISSAGEQMLRKRNPATGAVSGGAAAAGAGKVVKTFAIDEPI